VAELRGPQGEPGVQALPSEFFKRQIYGSFWFEKKTLKPTIDILGADNILYETDFPHPTSMSPGPATSATYPSLYMEEVFEGVDRKDVEKIVHGKRRAHLPPRLSFRALPAGPVPAGSSFPREGSPVSDYFDMSGKVVLVTGGSRGLGLEMVRAFAAAAPT
jgi:hypothetical protein